MSSEPLKTPPPVEKKEQKSEKSELKWTGCHYSGKSFRTRFIVYLILTIGYGIAFWYFRKDLDARLLLWAFWSIAIGVPLIVLWIPFWIRYLYTTLTISYVLDSERLVTKSGLFSIRRETLSIAQINDITFKQSLWDKLINGGVGTIVLHTSDRTDPTLHLKGVDNPGDAFDTLDMLKNKFINKRGIKSLGGGDILDNLDKGGI